MTFLADALPFVAVIAMIGMVILLVRLNRRVSRGSRSAGPRSVDAPDPVGLTATPWELEAIDLQLSSPRDSPARRDLVATVNRLIAASQNHTRRTVLPISAGNGEIEDIVIDLEKKLGLHGASNNPISEIER
jgi:hypothetical protein